jgi:hypothetical protein
MPPIKKYRQLKNEVFEVKKTLSDVLIILTD